MVVAVVVTAVHFLVGLKLLPKSRAGCVRHTPTRQDASILSLKNKTKQTGNDIIAGNGRVLKFNWFMFFFEFCLFSNPTSPPRSPIGLVPCVRSYTLSSPAVYVLFIFLFSYLVDANMAENFPLQVV